MEQKRIAVIGAGNMGTALLRGMLKAHWCKPGNLVASGRDAERMKRVQEELRIKVTTDNGEAARFADVVVFAVKPQILSQVLHECRAEIAHPQLVVSIAAGVPTSFIESHLPERVAVMRAIPNIAATVELGATALCRGKAATDAEAGVAESIFKAVGVVVAVDESLMDAVTGRSGTGPMYIFQIIEGLSDAGVKMGLSRSTSNILSVQTVLGSAKMVADTGQHPGLLKDLVTSPGGTAIAALHSMERNGLRALLIDAVEVATRRSAELGTRAENESSKKK
ncbi:MAG: pyrroline-5-carboxylate reductase [Euryarchaeota archaeon]|nr:pyrroline-5-carboxylate reductase [Euryarchaeota archaeon]